MKKIFIIIISLILTSCGAISDSMEQIGQGYYIIHEGPESNVIGKDEYMVGDKYIPCNVVDYDYNDDFIIASQNPKSECFYGEDNNIYGTDDTYYWIIDHKKNLFLGPLSFQEYIINRKKLNVPDNLQVMHN